MSCDGDELAVHVAIAAGRRPADLVLRNGQVVNVHSGECYAADVAIQGEHIVGVGDYSGHEEVDISGAYILPGLIDGHIHIESTALCVPELTKCMARRGTTAVVADPPATWRHRAPCCRTRSSLCRSSRSP